MAWPLTGGGFALFVIAHAHAITAPFALPLLLFCFCLSACMGQIDFGQRLNQLDVALLIVGATWLLCCITAVDSVRAFALSTPTAVSLFSVAVLCRVTKQVQNIDVMLQALALMAGWLGAVAILTSLVNKGSVESIVAAVHSPLLVVPNDLAWAACLWPLWMARWGRTGGIRLSLLVMLWTLLCGALIALESRLGLLLLGLATTFEFTARLRLRNRWLLIVSVAFVLALVLPGLFDKGMAGTVARMQLWEAAWEIFLQHPLLGVGPHGFVDAYPDVRLSGGWVDPRLTSWPHSLPLELLAEGGIIMVLAASLLLFCCRDAFREWSSGSALALFLLLCLVEASTLRLWFWVLLVIFLLPSGTRTFRT